jgi:ABC-type uncharacterized transport system permease subunit
VVTKALGECRLREKDEEMVMYKYTFHSLPVVHSHLIFTFLSFLCSFISPLAFFPKALVEISSWSTSPS